MPDPTPLPILPATKPGILTTEFWLGAILKLFGVLVGTGVLAPDSPTAVKVAGFATAVLAYLGYTVSRTAVKNNAGTPIAGQLLEQAPAAAPPSSTGQAGMARLPVLLVIVAIGTLALLASCASVDKFSATPVGAHEIDCGKAELAATTKGGSVLDVAISAAAALAEAVHNGDGLDALLPVVEKLILKHGEHLVACSFQKASTASSSSSSGSKMASSRPPPMEAKLAHALVEHYGWKVAR